MFNATRLSGMGLATALSALVALGSGMAQAQDKTADYPSKTVRIVVPYSAGGGTDVVARILANELQEAWKHPVIVENRTGAGGNVGTDAVYKAEPDGHTILFAAQGPIVVNESLYKTLTYKPSEFEPVSLVVVAHSALLVNPKLPVKNVEELIALAKKDNKLTFASQGVGTAAHLTGELFNSMAGTKVTHVPYKGSGPALTDLVAGHVSFMFGELAAARPFVETGKLRMLAVSADKRIESMPDVPAMAEVLPGFTVNSWWAVVAPPKTPKAVVEKLSQAIAKIVRKPEVEKRLREFSMVPQGSTPAELSDFAAKERKLWGKMIELSGVEAR